MYCNRFNSALSKFLEEPTKPERDCRSKDRTSILRFYDKKPLGQIIDIGNRSLYSIILFDSFLVTKNFILGSSLRRNLKFAVWLMSNYGLRIGEVANLKTSDFDFQRKRLVISFKINWKTKNRHERSLPLTDDKIKIIKTYLKNRPTNSGHDYVIYSVKRKHPVTVRSIQRWLKPIHPITAHWMRYSFAYDLYKRSGNDIKLTSKLLGHANVSTTSDYLESNQELLLEEARAFM